MYWYQPLGSPRRSAVRDPPIQKKELYCDWSPETRSQQTSINKMFDYSDRFIDVIFNQGIWTPPRNSNNSCR